MRNAISVVAVALVASDCTLSPAAKNNLRLAVETGKATANAALKLYVCKAVEKTYPVSGGTFTVPSGACHPTDAPNGDLLLRVSGDGAANKFAGLVALDFSVEASARYTVRWSGDRVYLLPKDVTVGAPVVTAHNAGARLAESFGMVTSNVNDQLRAELEVPRTYLLVESCIVRGWVAPNQMPSECKMSNGFVKHLGVASPLAQVPRGWEERDVGAVNVGTALAPANPRPQTWTVDMVDRLRRWSEQSAPGMAVPVMGILHPTGKRATLTRFDIIDDGDRVSLTMMIAWRGGILGTAYETTVRWVVSEAGHVRAAVDRDNATIPVAPSHASQLDAFFRDQVFASLPAPAESVQPAAVIVTEPESGGETSQVQLPADAVDTPGRLTSPDTSSR